MISFGEVTPGLPPLVVGVKVMPEQVVDIGVL